MHNEYNDDIFLKRKHVYYALEGEMNKILRRAQNDKKENRSLYIIEILKRIHPYDPLKGIISDAMLK